MVNGRLRDTSLIVNLDALRHNIQEQKKVLPENRSEEHTSELQSQR